METTEQENLPFVWFFTSLLEEGHKTIISWRKNFTKLTLILILPALSFIFLAEIHASNALLSPSHRTVVILSESREVNTYIRNRHALVRSKYGAVNITKHHSYDQHNFSPSKWIIVNHHRTADLFSSEQWIFLGLFRSLCLIPFLVLSPIPIAATVYYVAIANNNNNNRSQIVISKEVVINVTFSVWKRLLIFSYQGYVAILSFITLAVVVMTCLVQALAALPLVSFLETIYFMGLFYLCAIWQMTTVLHVLDEAYSNSNFSKIRPWKNWEIIEGKTWAKAIVLFNLTFLHVLATIFLDVGRAMYGIYCLVLLSMFSLFALVVQNVMFYACKIYHLEHLERWCSVLGDDHQVAACQEENGCMKDMDVLTQQLEV